MSVLLVVRVEEGAADATRKSAVDGEGAVIMVTFCW
jgi:hypothetical protein